MFGTSYLADFKRASNGMPDEGSTRYVCGAGFFGDLGCQPDTPVEVAVK